jgi:hypothetical protein
MLQPALRVWLATSLLFPIHDSLSAQTRPLAARGTFSTAPRIGGREFFERVGAVQLSVRTGPGILENTTRERLAAVARDALAARGIRVVERGRRSTRASRTVRR